MANAKLPGEFKGFTRVFHGLHNCVNFIHKLSPVVTGVAALEGGRRDAGVTLCGYSPRKFSPTNSVQQ